MKLENVDEAMKMAEELVKQLPQLKHFLQFLKDNPRGEASDRVAKEIYSPQIAISTAIKNLHEWEFGQS